MKTRSDQYLFSSIEFCQLFPTSKNIERIRLIYESKITELNKQIDEHRRMVAELNNQRKLLIRSWYKALGKKRNENHR